MVDENKITIINNCIALFFKENDVSYCKPKDLMEYLIRAKLFEKDYRNGLPLRKYLRELDDNYDIYSLILNIRIERKKKNRFWYFDRQ